MITYKDERERILLYDDAIDLTVIVTLPKRTWNKARTEYTDQRVTVAFPSRTFTSPESGRLAELLRQASNLGDRLNQDFDRKNLDGNVSEYNVTD